MAAAILLLGSFSDAALPLGGCGGARVGKPPGLPLLRLPEEGALAALEIPNCPERLISFPAPGLGRLFCP